MSEFDRKVNLTAPKFEAGKSGNPGGKPAGARNRITAFFLNTLAKDFEEHGPAAIVAMRTDDPSGYVKVVAGLLPKQVETIQPLEDIEDADIAAAIAILQASRTPQAAATGAEPSGGPTQTH